MKSIGGLAPLFICLSILILLCPLVSASSAYASLWGKKLEFKGPQCLWQLRPEVKVPALTELSICILLKRTLSTEWTGFLYRSRDSKLRELGLGGKADILKVWLFGKQYKIYKELETKEWNSICLTWSAENQRLRVYLNGTILREEPVFSVDTHQQLGQHGTLTLGVSHIIRPDGEVQPESATNLLGEIGLFRMWGREWSAEEVSSLGCADGDVLRWDLQQWEYDCPPVPDNNLYCSWSKYKVQMWTSISPPRNSENCFLLLEEITRSWLVSIFPNSTSVQDIFISSQRPTCNVHQKQDMAERSNSTCEKCFSCEVYVTVDPTADVKKVQTDISALLSSIFSFNFLTIEVVYDSIMVLPAVILPHVTGPTPTLSVSLTTSEKGLTRSPQPQPVNKSTTGGPLDRSIALVMPDQFFRVNLTLCIRGSLLRPNDFIENWLKHQLETNGTMTVVNLIIKDSSSRSMKEYTNLMTSYTEEEQYNCAFHVREFRKSNVADVESIIYFALISKYGNASFEIQTKNVSIKHIEPKNCLKQDISSIYGQYNWPETFPQDIADMRCIKPVSNRAYRLCKLDIKSDTTNWAYPDMKNCDKVVTISEISNITVTPGNAAEVVDIIQDAVDAQLSNKPGLSFSELGSVMEKLSEVVDVSIIGTIVGNRIVHIVANILLSETDITPVADILLGLTDQMGNSMEFSGEYANIKAHALAFSMINVDPEEFNGLTFSVSLSSTMNPEVFVNQSFVNQSHAEANATISLPTELINFFPHGVRNTTRVQFHFYGTLDLFQDPYLNNETTRNMTLNSFVVSASVNNSQVINLKERVVVTLKHKTPKMTEDEVQCMFWDFQKYDGHGGWNNSGCETLSESAYWTSCLCDHLTHFAVLLDVTRGPLSDTYMQVLSVISYLGCGVSGFFLGITLLTYLIFEKLRQDYPSKILINLSTALLGLSIFFLVDSWISSFSNYGLCIAAAAFLHFFLLASCTWMGLEAVHMYIALVKVFNIYMPFYLLRLCIIGWGVPLLIVSLVLAIDKDAYGSSIPVGVAHQSSEEFCWLQKKVFYNVTVVGFILLIFLGNITVFILVVIQIKKMRANNPSANSRTAVQDLRVLVGLTVLLGLTWSMGFLSFGPGRVVVLCLFALLNSFQGFFVFLFHCLMKENVRKQWRMYFCGRFRIIESLEWTRSVTVGRRNKGRNLINSDSLPSDNSSSIRSNNST